MLIQQVESPTVRNLTYVRFQVLKAINVKKTQPGCCITGNPMLGTVRTTENGQFLPDYTVQHPGLQ
jgi:hypothetical protein